MSFSAAHESKALRRNCKCCRQRKARFQFRGAVRADRAHTLCFECYRSQRDRRRAEMLADRDRSRSAVSPFGGDRELTERSVVHRRAMLAHLQRQQRPARG
jgi:hypothetical protein